MFASPRGHDPSTQSVRSRPPGSVGKPFRTPQRLVNALRPGQTGCLRSGTYALDRELRFDRGGHAGAAITLRSYPGERATLTNGFVYVVHGADYVTVKNLNIDAGRATENSVQIMSAHTVLQGNNITNHNHRFSCIILGSDLGWGRAANTLVADNVIHQCGSAVDGREDHGIYVDNVVNATITRNVIWGSSAWGLHLYPDAQGSRVTYNVIDRNGGGIVFGGNSLSASGNNYVAHNIVANSSLDYNLEEYWGGAIGTGNIATENCLFNANGENIVPVREGFRARNNVVLANVGYVDRARPPRRIASPC